jgi:hypothetical protein
MRERTTQLQALDQMTGERDDAVLVSRACNKQGAHVTPYSCQRLQLVIRTRS